MNQLYKIFFYTSRLNPLIPNPKNNAVNPKSTTISNHIAPNPAPFNITALNASFA